MIFRKSFLASILLGFLSAASYSAANDVIRIGDHYWPTPNREYMKSGRMEGVVQPTVSGKLSSGIFGCVRNGGYRFHEGVDLKPIARDKRNESIDPIYAFHEGIVRYVSRKASSSSYGRYIVIEHPSIAPGLVTLYGHLRSIPLEIEAGVKVEGGQEIAVMGRSAGGYTIPRSRAHLHFELGFWLGDDFQTWYDKQPFGSPNEHGAFNGMNIVGTDTWDLFRKLRYEEVHDAWEFLLSEPVAVQAFVRSKKIPAILKANPYLLENASLPEDHVGWRIQFTWYGMPIGFRALIEEEFVDSNYLSVVTLRPDLIKGQLCMELVRGNPAVAGAKLRTLIGRMFVD